ncbi:hydrogenase expression/formation protein HypE [Flavobacteriaceae bacterium]|jgi:hydrogenase expression/formation protein HypE|nr:hydrogenase expression/formation protein HypE [Flavobacteriaceae bacterium]MDB4264245.1 hydrogenase expression/formation protein HypE [Flavobacteriaceae bacterium]
MSEKNLKMKLHCPMPELDFDIITLGHGSGGLLTNKLLDSGVFHLFDNEYLQQRHDGAVLKLEGETAFTTDSFVISPIFFPDSNIGELAVNGTVNDLAMCGAIPQYLSLSFIIEEGLKMTEFWEILIGIKSAAEEANVQIVTGDTKVVEKGKGDKIFINTSGVGKIHKRAQISTHNVKAGDKIIVSDGIATHGVAIMSVREGLEFETAVKSDTRGLNHMVTELLDEFGEDIHVLKDPTRGGVATVLNEIARDRNLGIEISQKQLPIQNEVSALCEILGLDPLYVANEGIFIAVVDVQISEEVVTKLQRMDYGTNASIIGEVTESHPRQVVLTSSIGGKRIVNMLVGEQLPRIC